MQVSFKLKPGSCSLLCKAIADEQAIGYYVNAPSGLAKYQEADFIPVKVYPKNPKTLQGRDQQTEIRTSAGAQILGDWFFYSSCNGNWLAINQATYEARFGGARHAFLNFAIPVEKDDCVSWAYPQNATWTPKLTPWEVLSKQESDMLAGLKKSGLLGKTRAGLLSPKLIKGWDLPIVPVGLYFDLIQRTGA